jgi:2-keto-4-pentenoate hydratase/2-oxohepta-3-ene-1,7-dioic acid hydratase in catechol pathway
LKLACFSTGAPEQLGLVLSDGILPLSALLPSAPATMIELIERWEELAPELARLDNDCALLPLDSVRLLAPVRAPRKIMGIGLNYADHVSESGLRTPSEQLWFSKPPTASNGPYDPIVRPRVSRQLDYEAELVIVIGKKCRYADAKAAAGSIFGYCAGNDVQRPRLAIQDFAIHSWQILRRACAARAVDRDQGRGRSAQSRHCLQGERRIAAVL